MKCFAALQPVLPGKSVQIPGKILKNPKKMADEVGTTFAINKCINEKRIKDSVEAVSYTHLQASHRYLASFSLKSPMAEL